MVRGQGLPWASKVNCTSNTPSLSNDIEDPTPCQLITFWESSILHVDFYFPSDPAHEATPLKEKKKWWGADFLGNIFPGGMARAGF